MPYSLLASVKESFSDELIKTQKEKTAIETNMLMLEQNKSKKLSKKEVYADYDKSEANKDALYDINEKRKMLLYANTLLQGSARLLNTKDTKVDGAGGGADGKYPNKSNSMGTGVTIEAQVPKNQYITINGGLIHEQVVNSVDGSIPAQEIKQTMSTILVELLNDAYQAQR